MSDNILERIRKTNSAAIPISPDLNYGNDTSKASDADISNFEGVTLKVNKPGAPLSGYTMSLLADELGAVVAASMQKAGISSIEASNFGLISSLSIKPKQFKLFEDPNSGKTFYTLKGFDRTVALYKKIVEAINQTISENVSFNYERRATLKLPVKVNNSTGVTEYQDVDVDTLFMTKEEINSLNYSFIKEIKFIKAKEGLNGDMLGLVIDREEWSATPYRTSHVL